MTKISKNLSALAGALIGLTFSVAAADVSSIQLSKAIQADGMSLASDGKLYVASAWNGTSIAAIDPSTGKVVDFADGLKGPIDITQTKDGGFYTTNWQGDSITYLSPQGELNTWVTVGPKGDALATDSNGNVWFTIGSANEIRKISPDGTATTVAKDGILKYPLGIAITEKDEVFVGGGQSGEIYKLSESNGPQLFTTVPGPGPWRIGHLLYANGRLFASGLNSNKVFEIAMDGSVSHLAGSGAVGHEDGDAKSATFTFPVSLEISSDNKSLYVFSGMEKTDKLRVINIEG